MQVKFDGLEGIVSRLRQMENTESIEKNALEKAGEHIRNEMSKAAPYKEGTLSENIVKTDVKEGAILIGTEPKGDGFYGYFHEYGTSKMPARPWVRPTWESNKVKVQNIMSSEIKKGLKL
ncbi:HK97-gp10 family putative phage morphogenesis protein [Jeotgalibacillus sp. S-D1]|uniref:HK97-gp10 family putative phage morphogenesis protein n=1 Tax=Jeotgalibacillus sp. S-D1 TaxID=2552189 RepID=UPI0014044AD4|nr:HK97-gp10 family putative phage morphogenesis protein [Jeotgalibacillus sp. S-D1]